MRIPATIQPHGVDDMASALGVVAGGMVVVVGASVVGVVVGGAVVGASVVGVVGGTVVVGASVVGVVTGGTVVVGASGVGAVVDGRAIEGLLVGVDGDASVVLGRLAGGFVDPEPPQALRVSAARAKTRTDRYR